MNNPRFCRNIISIVCLFLLVANCSSDDDGSDVIAPQPKVFEGNVILSSQSDVDDFGIDGYNVIDGFLFIGVNNPNAPTQTTDIDDLSVLLSVSSVQNGVTIYNNPLLSDLNGLNSLTFINGGALIIDSNENLVSISALTGLASFKSLEVWDNPSLLNLDGLEGVQSARESVVIINNENLININGLSGLTTIGEFLIISDNTSLASINGLNNLENVDRSITLRRNTVLPNLDGFSNLLNVGENMVFEVNEALTNYCGLEPLFIEGGYEGGFIMFENAYNPTADDMINGNCSL